MAAAVVASGALVTTRPRKGYLRVNSVDVYHPCNVASVTEEPRCVVEILFLGIEPAVLGKATVGNRGKDMGNGQMLLQLATNPPFYGSCRSYP